MDYMLNDNMGKPCFIVFKYGWSKFANDKNKYLGTRKNNTFNFPGTGTFYEYYSLQTIYHLHTNMNKWGSYASFNTLDH